VGGEQGSGVSSAIVRRSRKVMGKIWKDMQGLGIGGQGRREKNRVPINNTPSVLLGSKIPGRWEMGGKSERNYPREERGERCPRKIKKLFSVKPWIKKPPREGPSKTGGAREREGNGIRQNQRTTVWGLNIINGREKKREPSVLTKFGG